LSKKPSTSSRETSKPKGIKHHLKALLKGNTMKSEGENIRRNAQTNILQYFIKHGVGNLVYKGLDYKAIQSMRTSWDVDKLRKYLGNKHGIKILNKAVEETTVYSINEDALLKLIRKGKITEKELKRFIISKPSVPFVRALKVKDEA